MDTANGAACAGARRAIRMLGWFIRRSCAWRRQRVTASVMTKNGGARLPRLLSQRATFADEIIIGVDDSSVDNTLQIAEKWADVVYRFTLTGHTAPARELVFKYATGDWILSIDDDELLEDGFGEVVRDVISDRTITHAWFPRKCIISLEPCLFAYAPALYPDWQRRLFRNDRTLAYKPSKVHSGYWVSGHGLFEPRASILHLEQIVSDVAARAKKAEQYEALGFRPATDPELGMPADPATRPAILPTIRVTDPLGLARVKKRVHRLPRAPNPKWAAKILSVDTVSHARPGEMVNATVHVQNSGSLTWMPNAVAPPFVSLGTHLWDDQGNQLSRDKKDRFAVRVPVKPGGKTVFLVTYRAPEAPGTYSFEWDMVSDGEFWFGRRRPRASKTSKKSKTLRSTLVVGDHGLANPPSTNGNR